MTLLRLLSVVGIVVLIGALCGAAERKALSRRHRQEFKSVRQGGKEDNSLPPLITGMGFQANCQGALAFKTDGIAQESPSLNGESKRVKFRLKGDSADEAMVELEIRSHLQHSTLSWHIRYNGKPKAFDPWTTGFFFQFAQPPAAAATESTIRWVKPTGRFEWEVPDDALYPDFDRQVRRVQFSGNNQEIVFVTPWYDPDWIYGGTEKRAHFLRYGLPQEAPFERTVTFEVFTVPKGTSAAELAARAVSRPVTFEVRTHHLGNLFEPKEPVAFELEVKNVTPQIQEVRLAWSLWDYYGEKIIAGERSLQLRPLNFKAPTGSFLQLDSGNLTWTAQQWKAELKAMKNLGMDTLIIASVAQDNYAFYRSRLYSMWQKRGTKDPLATLLALAEKLGLKVFVGLYAWDWQRTSDFYEFARRCITVADEVWRCYKGCKAFAGWYILNWEIGNAPEETNQGVQAYRRVITHLRHLTPLHPILIAPYFSLDITPKAFEEGWRKLLSVLKPDIIALQDGIGCGRNLTPENVPPYFAAIFRACKEAKVRLWADVEVFDIPSGWKPAPVKRIMRQLAAVSPFVEKIVLFEFNHYLSPMRGLRGGQTLFEATQKLRTSWRLPVHLVYKKRGILFLDAKVKCESEEILWRTTFGILPKRTLGTSIKPADTKIPSPFGLAAVIANPVTYPDQPDLETVLSLAQRIGVRWIRGGWFPLKSDITEAEAQKAKRNFNLLCRLGISPHIHHNPSLPKTAEEVKQLQESLRSSLQKFWWMSDFIEIGNELNFSHSPAEYLEKMLKPVAEIMRAVHPKGKVMMMGLGGVSWDWLKKFEAAGGFDYLDVLSVHPGFHPRAPEFYEGWKGWVFRTQIMDALEFAQRHKKQVWITEVYAPTLPAPSQLDLRTSADYLVRTYVLAIALGVQVIEWYQFQDGVWHSRIPKPNDAEYNFGIVYVDLTPKPAYIAYGVMTEQLQGAKCLGRLDLGADDLYGIRFKKGKQLVDVLWSYREKHETDLAWWPPEGFKGKSRLKGEPWQSRWKQPVTIELPAVGKVMVTDIMGNTEIPPVQLGKVRLSLTGSPIFVLGLGDLPVKPLHQTWHTN